jgi:hypothetical protein
MQEFKKELAKGNFDKLSKSIKSRMDEIDTELDKISQVLAGLKTA